MAKQYFTAENTNQGTMIIRLPSSPLKKVKLSVRKGSQQLYFDFIGNEIVVPLIYGSGTYTFILYEQVRGSQYIQRQRKNINIYLDDNDLWQLAPNSYVDYNEESNFYFTAKQLLTIDKIYNYITQNINYNYIKAATVAKQFSYPDIEDCFARNLGICYDIAALMVAMCRICGIHASLRIGYCDKVYHAWVQAEGKNYDPTKKIIGDTKKHKYILERYY